VSPYEKQENRLTLTDSHNNVLSASRLLALFMLSRVNLQLLTYGQGSLTPPGTPAPTMKTLAQIEPRTPISFLPVTLSQPGS